MTETLTDACKTGDLSNVKRYLAEGIDPTLPNKYGHTNFPIYMASRWGHLDIVKALVEAKADPADHCTGSDSLQEAAERGHPKVVRYLLDYVDPKVGNDAAFRRAIRYGHKNVAKVLVADGRVSMNSIHKGLQKLCYFGVNEEREKLVKRYLRSIGGDPNAKVIYQDYYTGEYIYK